MGRLLNILVELVTHPFLGLDCMLMMRQGTCFPNEEKSDQSLEETGVSKEAGCQQKSLPTWLISAGYSAWHFFTNSVFSIEYPWTYFDNSAVYVKAF